MDNEEKLSKHQRRGVTLPSLDKGLEDDPFAYTAGRWLHLDNLHREARYIKFDISYLLERVLSFCRPGTSVKSCQKLEGGFSRAFIIAMDDGRRVIAKFPTSVAGPPSFVTNSEVATMTYLQRNTNIPIPNVMDWSDDPSNPMGSAYIIMEHAGGVPLQQIWPDMSLDQRLKCIGSICENIMKLSEINFPAYGSLYFADAPFLDGEPTQKLESHAYCIGPHCRTMFWDCNVGEPRQYSFRKPNRGPWSNLSSYCSALIDAGLARLPMVDTLNQPLYQGSVSDHLRLLDLGREVCCKLAKHPRLQQNATPTLFHPDLHKRNIFVCEEDPTIVTSFIDWQSTCIEPALSYADDVPDFAKLPPEETPEKEVTVEKLCSEAFNGGLRLLAPRLAAVREIDETLLRPLRYCHRTWRDGIVPLTHELIQLRDNWHKLGFQEECPIPALSSEEQQAYQERLDTYEKMLDVRQEIVSALGTEQDGWVPSDRFEEANTAHQALYESILGAMENEKDREDMEIMWPFDAVG